MEYRRFEELFLQATEGGSPFPYQSRFATANEPYHLVQAPTGAGKTATAILGWLWRLKFAAKEVQAETPRRLVYCLPMRVLVEQTRDCARTWLKNLSLSSEIDLHVLMGGIEAEEWFLNPERAAILIGTQDMLLSRALNRGYAASRFHWPIDFGLLNNDCLWVYDEPQLMGSGISTSAQLAGLRETFGTFGRRCPSVWMSATLEPTWLDTVDFKDRFKTSPLNLTAEDYDDQRLHKRMTAMKTLHPLGVRSSKDMKDVAKKVWEKHSESEGAQTLVVMNTVERAKLVYAELDSLSKKSARAKPLLVHSRFRPAEREELNKRVQEKGEKDRDRIIVATQVVEAGVDISARTLITELAPWASLVQRMGRCNRAGDDGQGHVFWIDLDDDKQAAPYGSEDLTFARMQLERLAGKTVSPRALDEFKRKEGITLPFEHKHVLRRRDLLNLFDTSPDLSGNDIDIQRFVRGDDPDTDVQILWRAGPPNNEWDTAEGRRQAARREELCNVPITSFRKDFLEAGKTAHRFDFLDGEWREVGKKDARTVIPGQTFWVVADQGGYDPQLGWSPASGRFPEEWLIPLPAEPPKSRRQRPEGFYDSDEWAAQSEWRTIAEHTNEVAAALAAILRAVVPLSDAERVALDVAARWHDWGKMHPVFQSGLRYEIDDPKELRQKPPPSPDRRTKVPRPERWRLCTEIAKAPQEYWRKYTRLVREATSDRAEVRRVAKRFRHELASALGIIGLLTTGPVPADWARLAPDERTLALYLIASHHGKVRLSIRAMPDESPTPDDVNRWFASGVWERDKLPGTALGANVRADEVELSLAPMQLGSGISWTAQALQLLERFGPFKLAYLEAMIRASDCRASSSEGDADG